jgi:transcriptional regulator with XRE-family HTH domain
MQPDELKRIRNALGFTQAEFGEALGVSRKLVNDLEAARAPIDRRTTLAVRQLHNECSRLFSSHNVRTLDTDVNLRDAMILWDCDVASKPPVLVIGDPTNSDEDYSSSAGSCSADWYETDDIGRLLRLLGMFVTMTVQDGYDPAAVHRAFSVIPEYRHALHRGLFTAEQVD